MSHALANVDSAPLPANYERAKTALAEAVELDECKQWADKAAALASYARQAKDDSLQKMAMRIHGRAVRRAGELLREIEPARGAHWGSKRDGTDPSISRTAAAREAGLSERQRKTAIAVAGIDADTFEAAIESDAPPTVTELRRMAPKERPAHPLKREIDALFGDLTQDPQAFEAATHMLGAFARLLADYRQSPPVARWIAALRDDEKTRLRGDLIALAPYLSETMDALS